jgi:arabinofuranosyltransferase
VSARERLGYAAIALLTALGLVVGWRTFWFLTDDAFIAFRYVSNRQFGLGYVWNPPPFRPVEGYTSFLWVVLLDAVWSLTGMEPPKSANRLSLGFSFVSTAVVFAMALRTRLSDAVAAWRLPLVALGMFAVVSNRTWLAWTSSGLETAMETTFVLIWTYLCVFVAPSRAQATLLALAASAMALCRPDGLLFCAVTGLLLLWRARKHGPAELIALAPFLLVVAHLLWRRSFYGYWLPNTYYAKHVGPWPLAGAAYLASFALEYFYLVWIGLAVVWLARAIRSWRAAIGNEATLFPVAGVAAIVLHWAYYTFNVGGDHFEYRVYHHLVPLIALSFPWLCDRLGLIPKRTVGLYAATVVIGLLIPWDHWWHTARKLDVPREQRHLHYDVAQDVPPPLSWYAMAFDGCQEFLIGHFVAMRWNSHAYFARFKQAPKLPTREEGLKIDGSDNPVIVQAAVGLPGWRLPRVIVIDKLGLNDLVVARTAPRNTGQTKRKMAHDRAAPKEYLDCFRPNVEIGGGKARVKPRKQPLTDDDVVACETEWLERVSGSER